MSDCSACGKSHHPEAFCGESLSNKINLIRARMGTDFETHGGKKVMFCGNLEESTPLIPYGSLGTIESTRDQMVEVDWDCVTENGIPNPRYIHPWSDVETLKTDEDGRVGPEEIERARLKTAPSKRRLALPCPFCGSQESRAMRWGKSVYLLCYGECFAAGPRLAPEFDDMALIAAWNVRAFPGALTRDRRGLPQGNGYECPRITMISDSLPCPFCAGRELDVTRDVKTGTHHLYCQGCGAGGPLWHDLPKTIEAALSSWKRRLPNGAANGA